MDRVMHLVTTLAVVFLMVGSALGVRPPAVAGSFYPADSAQLTTLVQSQLNGVPDLPQIDGEVIALVVPHAGLIYSGPVAAYAYKLIEGMDYDRVVICGPSHRYGFKGSSVCAPGEIWQTPLGKVRCDSDLCRLLIETAGISAIPEAHRSEHAVEVQLPFLQTVLHNFSIVPVAMGYVSHESVRSLGDGLESLPNDERLLLIASSDWQHYRSAAAGWPMDSLGIECLTSFDPERLDRLLTSGEVEACGGGDVVAVMRAARARGADKAVLLHYGNSGDITGDPSRVVGYVAAAFYRSDNSGKEEASSEDDPARQLSSLTPEQETTLLHIARQSLLGYLVNGEVPEFDVKDEQLRQPGAAFVTLTKHGQLRGCIGHTQAIEPLYMTVADCAVQAGVADPRFPKVTRLEIDDLHFEVSVLTPMQRVKTVDEIEVGRDGLMMISRQHRGLLLPQVATEYGWSREEFLQATCRKAGLPVDAWKKSSTEIYRFQALVFGE